MSFYCDWCGEIIENKLGLATLKVDGVYEEGGLGALINDERRHFHVGRSDAEESCLLRALALVDEQRPTRNAESEQRQSREQVVRDQISDYYAAWRTWPALAPVDREHRILNALGSEEFSTSEIADRLNDEQAMVVRNTMIKPMLTKMTARGDLERSKSPRVAGSVQFLWRYRRRSDMRPEIQLLEEALKQSDRGVE